EGTPKPRVLAYTHELDEWLHTRLNHSGTPATKKLKRLSRKQKIVVAAFALLIISASITYYIIRRPSPAPEQKASGVPQSTGPLSMKDGDILTTEYSLGGRLRVWRKNRANAYEEIWRMEPVRHASLAIGNLDGKKDIEIVAPGLCEEQENEGDKIVTKCRYFLNIYKPGKKDWWKTTYYNKENCLYENKFLPYTEIKIGDVDPSPGNEIVMLTTHGMGIFRYVPEDDEFKLMRSRSSFLNGKNLLMKSLVLANIDDDPLQEVIIAADEWENERTPWNKGWILICKVREGRTEIVRSIQVNANFAFHSLRIGDVVADGVPEIVAPGFRNNSDIWNSYIMAWTPDGEQIIDRQVYEKGDFEVKLIHIDVGELSPEPGEEIVVGLHDLDELACYSWNGSNLVEICQRFPLDYRVGLMNVLVKEAPEGKDSPAEIIVWGGSRLEDQPGRFYLEILDFHDGFVSTWKRLGGERGELPVSDAGFGISR
ncbi:MAG: hypothetical protein WBB73_06760, partial [Candidatus Aminicenantaceae bacterium]